MGNVDLGRGLRSRSNYCQVGAWAMCTTTRRHARTHWASPSGSGQMGPTRRLGSSTSLFQSISLLSMINPSKSHHPRALSSPSSRYALQPPSPSLIDYSISSLISPLEIRPSFCLLPPLSKFNYSVLFSYYPLSLVPSGDDLKLNG